MNRINELLAKEPVLVINAIVALATVAAGLGLDVDPTAVGQAVAALLVLAGVTRAAVWSPASVDEATREAANLAAWDTPLPTEWEER